MKELEEILLGGMFRPTEQNCPTREGELIESLDKIHDIPNPRVGMRVYVENTEKEYIIKSLKDKTIGGVNVPNAAVNVFEEVVDPEVVVNEMIAPLIEDLATESSNRLNADNYIKDNALQYDKIGFDVNADRVQLYAKNISNNNVRVDDIPAATTTSAGVMSAEDKRKLDAAGATKILWDASSNMNDFKTPGVYDIYGERTRQDDNLPILNASSGHSIAARLTVVASTLQPANNEICVTQFLQLSNRVGGDGATYVRTYNENNNGMNGWSPWQKQMGMIETLINSDDTTVGQEIFSNSSARKIGDGLNGMIDNGMYSGIYIDNVSYNPVTNLGYLSAQPTFVETFVLVVINDYAASGQAGLPRHITQLKYAVDALTNQPSVKMRTKTDGSDWSDWTDISGGGSQEVDVTDAVKTYGLPTLVSQGFVKEGVTYKVTCDAGEIPVLDGQNKIKNHIFKFYESFDDKVIFKIFTNKLDQFKIFYIDCYIGGSTAKYYKYIINDLGNPMENVKVSADMTTL